MIRDKATLSYLDARPQLPSVRVAWPSRTLRDARTTADRCRQAWRQSAWPDRASARLAPVAAAMTWAPGLGGTPNGSSRSVQAVGQYAVLLHFEPRGGRHESAHKIAQSELADAGTMGRAELRSALRYYEALTLGKD
jgi:hypothetical protein